MRVKLDIVSSKIAQLGNRGGGGGGMRFKTNLTCVKYTCMLIFGVFLEWLCSFLV